MFKNKISDRLYKISIGKQVFAVMITLFLFMFAALYIILFNSMGKMLLERESDDIKSQVSLVQNALNDSYEYLPNVTRDWGAFDQTYHYMQGGFEEFLPYYLNDYPYKIYSLDFIAVLDLRGNITYERFFEQSVNNINGEKIDLSALYKKTSIATISLLNNTKIDVTDPAQYSISGFVKHNGAMLYLSSCPILRTDRTGPVLGTIVFGRIISQSNLDSLNQNPDTKVSILEKSQLDFSEQQLQILSLGKKLVTTTDSSVMESYTSFKDIFGKDNLLISVSSPRHLYEEGIKNIDFAVLIVAFCCTIIMFIILKILNELVIKPIGLFVKNVHEIDFESRDLSITAVSKYKESKTLTAAINNMLFEIQKDRNIIKEKNETLYYNANFDLLTGLRNRANCRDTLTKEIAIAIANNNSTIVGVILLDLDRFKNINDTLDHTVGDKFIVAVSQRLQNELGNEVLIGRFGGDEFVIISNNLQENFKFHLYIDRVISLFKSPFVVGERELHITASIGSCTFPSDATDANTLLKNAEIAMYHAKKLGGNISCRYEDELNKVLQRKLYVENQIRAAINNDCKDFMAYFQPKALSVSGDIMSCEALIRWKTPDGIISPGEFIPLAEETGLIVPLSRWMLKESCRCNKIFEENGINHIVSVNISSQVLLHKDFLETIRESINETGMPMKNLDIELTEETLLEDMSKVIQILTILNDWGITSSIDDFGTGYSSLSYLKKLPVDRIKIDQSFISGLNANEDGDRPIVNAIVAMGKTLNKLITAEGVEDSAQYAYLKSIHCDEIQGYYISKPLPYEEYIVFYKNWLFDKFAHLEEVNKLIY